MKAFLSCFIVLLLRSNGFSQESVRSSIEQQVSSMPAGTQLSIAVIENGQPVYYGAVKETDSIRFIENSTLLFEIGSITKVFTATILARLINEKKIKPGATANHYFNFRFKDRSRIRLTDLASHTAGLPRLPSNFVTDTFDPDNPYVNYAPEDLETYLKNDLQLLSQPGTTYAYSNTGAGLLGYTLGLSQKSTYSKLLQELIFDQYGMSGSYTSQSHTGSPSRLVKGMNEEGKEVPNWDFDALAGAGCVLSSVEDLVKFALAQFDPSHKELELTRTPAFTINDNMKIAWGWHLVTSRESGREYIWHNGGTGGYSSCMVLDVERKNGIIILSNIPPSSGKTDQLCFDLMKQIK